MTTCSHSHVTLAGMCALCGEPAVITGLGVTIKRVSGNAVEIEQTLEEDDPDDDD